MARPELPRPDCRVPPAGDPADRVEVRLDLDAPPGNVLPALARLLRALRDEDRRRLAGGDKSAAAG
jgi:hypothetical protein